MRKKVLVGGWLLVGAGLVLTYAPGPASALGPGLGMSRVLLGTG